VPTTSILSLAAAVLHDAQPASGGYSGETFTGTWMNERAYVRMYERDPGRAVIDLAISRRLAGIVPMPRVLAAEPRPTRGLPPHIVTAAVLGQRADVLLDRGLGRPAATALGRQLARLVTLLRAVRFDDAGPFRDADLRVGEWPRELATLTSWYDHLEPGLASAGLGRRSAPRLRPALGAASGRLARATLGGASLVHGDLNGKNLLVDPDTGRLRAVLDWEFAYAGDWTTDVGNLLRSATAGAGGGPGAASWTALRTGLVDSLHAGLYEDGTATAADGVDDDWLRRAVDLDLFALLELAARRTEAHAVPPPVAGARQVLKAIGGAAAPR
jgi:hypothetical protein